MVQKSIALAHKKSTIILTGDSNSKVGSDQTAWESVMGKHSCGTRNKRVEGLFHFATEKYLLICNRRFQQKACR